jgi:hypothetical protein
MLGKNGKSGSWNTRTAQTMMAKMWIRGAAERIPTDGRVSRSEASGDEEGEGGIKYPIK